MYPARYCEKRDMYWRRYKIQETLYIWCLSPLQSRCLGTSHTFPSISSTVQNTLQNPLLESPSATPFYFPESHWWSEISSLLKVILVLRKARSHRAPNLGCRGCWVTWVIWCFTKKLCTRCDAWMDMCHDEAANHQLPIAVTVFMVLHLSTDEKHWTSY